VAMIVGMPVKTANKIFNTAVVIQGGHILGVVPKTYLSNAEKRWFASVDSPIESIELDDRIVPFSTNLLFTDKKITFGIEIGDDLCAPIPPSCQHAMHGAEVIFNLSASNELVGKTAFRRQLIEQHSARIASGYVYASAGTGESTTDLVFSGSAFVAENGCILEEGERFKQDNHLIVSEIDIERLQAERFRNSNFENAKSNEKYRIIKIEDAHYTEFSLKRTIEKLPFVPKTEKRNETCEDIFSIQTAGLAKRWKHTNTHSLVIGVSGGLDSTLALLACVKTADLLNFDRKRIIGITMPGFGTTDRTYKNAIGLMKNLGISTKEISIKEACLQHFKDIEHDPNVHDTIYENVQARERTQILMDIANKENGLVIGTGDLSELALGWTTYNGDHISMYAINSGVPKTLVRYLVDWFADQTSGKTREILKDITNTPVSPELLPADTAGNIAQKTEDIVGPYELHDFFLYYFVRFGFEAKKIYFLAQQAFKNDYSDEEIKKWLGVFLNRFFSQQFKRSCMPDSPKIGTVNLSPRGDWRMPSDAVAFELEEE
jgi:NAD+ synthase (glutamine-hydrolysing)